jgi:hypothetical protein
MMIAQLANKQKKRKVIFLLGVDLIKGLNQANLFKILSLRTGEILLQPSHNPLGPRNQCNLNPLVILQTSS